MCELLGMSSNQKTVINLSLSVLANRGENPNFHGDGWGIAFHDENDVRLIKDAGEAKKSKWVEFIKQQEIRCHDIIAHIRKSTVGKVKYSNTHPFTRELLGNVHSFAHNGTYSQILTDPRYATSLFHPIGDTDSEHSFCVLMDRMSILWKQYKKTPPLEKRLEVVTTFAEEMRRMGPANFLYSDGETLFAHGHERHDPVTKQVSWPGLHYLQLSEQDEILDTSQVADSSISFKRNTKKVVLFASVPLNEGNWRPLKSGEIIAVNKGQYYPSIVS